MNSGPAGDDDTDVLGTVGDADMIGVADFGEPARPAMPQSFDAALGKARQRDAGALEHRVADLVLADTVAGQSAGVLRAHDKERPGREDNVVVAKPRRGADKVLENVLPGLAAVSKDIMRRRRADRSHRVLLRGEAGLDMERRPGAVGFRFRDTGAELAGLAVRRHVGLAGDVAADIA